MHGLELLVLPHGCGGGHWNFLRVVWYLWMKPLSRRASCSAPTGPLTGAAGAKAEWQSRPGGTALQPRGCRPLPCTWGKIFLRKYPDYLLLTNKSQLEFLEQFPSELKTALSQCIFLQLKCHWRHHNANWNTFLLSATRPGTASLHLLWAFKLSLNHVSASVTTCDNCTFHDPFPPPLTIVIKLLSPVSVSLTNV